MQGSGLTAAELALVLTELEPLLAAARVTDVARLVGRDDLLLFLELPDGRRALHIAPGGKRARLTLTTRRFRREEFATGPLVDRLRETLRGARFKGCAHAPDERRCDFALTVSDGTDLNLHVELFGVRGLWCVTDADESILELSRLPKSAGRELRPGAKYLAPAAARRLDPGAGPRFTAPYLDAVDAYFTSRDAEEEIAQLQKTLDQAVQRARRKLQNKIDGLARQQEEIGRVAEIRLQADMLLAYGFGLAPGADRLEVSHPQDPSRRLEIAIDPAVPIQKQAERLYNRARKLEDGAAIAARRKAEAEADLAALAADADDLAACETFDDSRDLRAAWIARGILVRPKAEHRTAPSKHEQKLRKITKGHNVRVFTSSEGHLILVGRTNQQNDRLSLSIARGNDLWLHVGRGYAGSHVVVRLPKAKTASLQTLIEAGTLAIHFSKARNASRCEVIYTAAKNVRKPKGLPQGRVTTSQAKTLDVDVDPALLRRLLDTARGDFG